MQSLAVIGSLNMDIVNRVQQAPQQGQTIKALETSFVPGGKGANQAVAAARAGAAVEMIGAIGDDAYGQILKETLTKAGAGTDGVTIKMGLPSGVAFITVDAQGENNIIVSEGANGQLGIQDIKNSESLLIDAERVLFQNEIPYPTLLYALEYLASLNKYIIYNPAPAVEVPPEVYRWVSLLILNETEAEALTGFKVDTEEEILRAAQRLVQMGCREVILTLGVKGLLYTSQEGMTLRMKGFEVDALDTTAAGDTFVGAYAAGISETMSIKNALRFASGAAALAVTKKGAQTSIPLRAEIDAFLSREFIGERMSQ